MLIKYIHVTTVVISIGVFLLRFYWMLIDSRLLKAKPVKIIPHVNDTILLVSAIVLVVQLRQYPFVHHWLTAKVTALVVYIVLGSLALKRCSDKRLRIVSGVGAILTFAFILSVAASKNPLGFLSMF